MTIVDPSIRAGDSIYLLTPHGLEAVGRATRAGVVTVKFTTDPAFVVAAVPKVAHLAATVLAKTNAVQVTIGCAPGVACTGSAQLSAENGRLVLANGTVNVPAGRTVGVRLADTVPGRQYLSAYSAWPLKATVRVELLGAKSVQAVLKLR